MLLIKWHDVNAICSGMLFFIIFCFANDRLDTGVEKKSLYKKYCIQLLIFEYRGGIGGGLNRIAVTIQLSVFGKRGGEGMCGNKMQIKRVYLIVYLREMESD